MKGTFRSNTRPLRTTITCNRPFRKRKERESEGGKGEEGQREKRERERGKSLRRKRGGEARAGKSSENASVGGAGPGTYGERHLFGAALRLGHAAVDIVDALHHVTAHLPVARRTRSSVPEMR
eukprot:3253336-Rhodomonas_salina.1